MKKIILYTDTNQGRLAIVSERLTDWSNTFNVSIGGVELVCNSGETAANIYEYLAKQIAEGKILSIEVNP